MIDVVTPDGVAVDVKDAVADLALRSGPEILGRLVDALVKSGALDADQLRRILPDSYEVRE